jgi:hypothetical protein
MKTNQSQLLKSRNLANLEKIVKRFNWPLDKVEIASQIFSTTLKAKSASEENLKNTKMILDNHSILEWMTKTQEWMIQEVECNFFKTIFQDQMLTDEFCYLKIS